MRKLMGASLVVLMAGCQEWQDTFEGLTNPLVTQSMILGVEAPDDDNVDLEDTALEEGTSVQVFLADATNANELEEAPVNGATVTVLAQGEDAELSELGGGSYLLAPGELEYQPNQDWAMDIGIEGDTATAEVFLPPGADLDLPETHAVGATMDVDVSGQGYDAVLVFVLDVASGSTTWSNEPEDIQELYEFTRADSEVEAIIVPGEAFPEDGLHMVGVAGMEHTTDEDVTNMNTALSRLTAGQMRLFPVTVE